MSERQNIRNTKKSETKYPQTNKLCNKNPRQNTFKCASGAFALNVRILFFAGGTKDAA